MIRLVASDIDGTLLQGGARALSDELFGLIRVLKKRGILFCAASGRQYRSMRALFAQAEDDIAYLCENGAIVYRGGSVVSKLAMERADALALIGQIQAQEQCEVLISGADTSYLLPKHPDYVDHIRYFVGNHITRVKRAQDIPEDILKAVSYTHLDHCSPISDTTIMASAGAQCDHVQHVSTQLPYAITAAAVSCISYVAAGLLVHFELPGLLALPFGLAPVSYTHLDVYKRQGRNKACR